MYIIDATVALKWFIDEEDSGRAEALLRSGNRLLAPEIIRCEVATCLTLLNSKGLAPKAVVQDLLDAWEHALSQQALATIPLPLDYAHAVDLSLEGHYPLNDCFYLAAARRLQAPLVTASQTMRQAAGSCAVSLAQW